MVTRPFQAPRWVALLILPLLAGLAAVWIRFAPPVNTEGAVRLRMELPADLGPYGSQLILHCQNPRCRQSFFFSPESVPPACPTCGGELSPVALAERVMLPRDTRIVRRVYRAPGTPSYAVTIVLAGADPRSIHRPQQCLPAQGSRIDRQYTKTLALTSGRSLTLAVIDARLNPSPQSRFGFAYWFVGPKIETASNYVRLLWTTYDHLFHNTVSHWAYVSITASEPLDSPESLERLASFLRLLVPAIEIQPPSRP